MRAVMMFATALVGMILSQRQVEAMFPAVEYEKSRVDAWSGQRLRHLFSGFELAAADLYWLRAVQYYGGQRAFAPMKKLDLVEPLVENVITLDPRFAIAYQLGAVFLAEQPPVGLGRPDAAVRLLDRGTGAIPQNWTLQRDAGLFRFQYLGDAAGAVFHLRESATLPGAPFWLATLAADLAGKAGDRQAAREIWTSLANSDQAFIRENARRNLLHLDALSLVAALQRKVDQFRLDHGVVPASWVELIDKGAIPARPRDPLGVDLLIEDGRVAVSKRSPLWRPDPHAEARR